MIAFLKKRYNILIPVFLIIVLLIATLLYTREYKNNRYAENKDEEVYQYFSKIKTEYTARIGRSRKNAVLAFEPTDFNVSLGSTPIYLKNKESVIFPKEMSAVFPLTSREYKVNALTEVTKKDGHYHFTSDKLDKSFNHLFLYDGKDLYFFFDKVTINIEGTTIELSPLSYVNCIHNNLLEYYDKASDTYNQLDIKEEVHIINDYMNIDVNSDKLIYKNDFLLLTNDFSYLSKISDIDS